MVTVKEAALSYVRAGFRVLPLYTVVQDPVTELWKCDCPLPAGSCRSGKHPRGDLAPRGSIDATRDPALIAAWPDRVNVGIVGHPNLPIIDIDHEQIALQLLDPAFELKRYATAVRTGRGAGVHLYVQTGQPTANGLIKLVTGQKVGEVRAKNLYVVAPPSQHESGRRYEWLSTPADVGGVVRYSAGDGWEYVTKLLAKAGVGIMPHTDEVASAELAAPVVAQPFPFDLPVNIPAYVPLRGYLTGTSFTTDRSGYLFKLGCEIWRWAVLFASEEQRSILTVPVVAGVLKQVDGVQYRKFRRTSGDVQYTTIAVRSRNVALKPRERKRKEAHH